MKESVESAVHDILAGVEVVGIEVPWRTNAPEYRGSERDSDTTGDTGFDLAGTKEWEPGERLAVRPTAKTGWRTKYTLVYDQPRELSVFVIVEGSPSIEFGIVEKQKQHLSAALLASALENTAATMDLAGYAFWSGNLVKQFRAVQPAGRLTMQALFGYLDPDAEDDGYEPSETQSGLAQALERLPMDRRCLVFIISDFQRFNEADLRALEDVSGSHDMIACVVGDPRERDLPGGTGFRDIEDIGTGSVAGVHLNDRTRKQWRDSFNRERLELRSKLAELGVAMQEFFTNETPVELNEKLSLIYGGHRPFEPEETST
jgi:hypothetical protein